LDASFAGPIRHAPELVKKQRKIRQLGAAEETVSKLVNAKLKHISDSSISRYDDGEAERHQFGATEVSALEALILKYQTRNSCFARIFTVIQSHFRKRSFRRWYLVAKRAVDILQRYVRRLRFKKEHRRLRAFIEKMRKTWSTRVLTRALKKFIHSRIQTVVVLQSAWRFYLKRKTYLRLRRSVKLLQSVWRMHAVKTKYARKKTLLTKLQQVMKSYQKRLQISKDVRAWYIHMLSLLLLLWETNKSPLIYRTHFWTGMQKYRKNGGPLFICMGILRQEINRWLQVIGAERSSELQFGVQPVSAGEDPGLSKYLTANRSALIASFSKPVTAVVNAAGVAEESERKLLYANIKKDGSPAELQKIYAELPGVVGSKKRKQTLAQVVWTFGPDHDKADVSSKACVLGFPNEFSTDQSLSLSPMIKSRRSDVIQSACASATTILLATSKHANRPVKSKVGGR
jgi:hypothetical protein